MRFAPTTYTPDIRDDVVNVLNDYLKATDLVPNAAELSAADLALANRRFIEKTLPEDIVPVRVGFVAVLDGATGAVVKLIDIEKPGFIRAVNDELVYVVQDRKNVVAVNPQSGAVKTVLKGLDGVGGVTTDEQGRLYVSVQGKVQQVLHVHRGREARGCDRPPGRTPGHRGLGPGRGAQPRRAGGGQGRQALGGRSKRDAQALQRVAGPGGGGHERGRLPQGLFRPHALRRQRRRDQPARPEHHGRRGLRVADRPEDRSRCLPGNLRRPLHQGSALYAEGSNDKLYLVTINSPLSRNPPRLNIRERLGDGQFALRGTIEVKEMTTVFWADANGDEQQQPDELTTHPAALTMARLLRLVDST